MLHAYVAKTPVEGGQRLRMAGNVLHSPEKYEVLRTNFANFANLLQRSYGDTYRVETFRVTRHFISQDRDPTLADPSPLLRIMLANQLISADPTKAHASIDPRGTKPPCPDL